MILTLSVSIWPSVYAVLLSESEFLKSSLSTPKATDSDVKLCLKCSTSMKNVILAMNFYLLWCWFFSKKLLLFQQSFLFLQVPKGTAVIQDLILFNFLGSNIVLLTRDGTLLPAIRRFILELN